MSVYRKKRYSTTLYERLEISKNENTKILNQYEAMGIMLERFEDLKSAVFGKDFSKSRFTECLMNLEIEIRRTVEDLDLEDEIEE